MASAPLNWLARIGGAKLNTRKAELVADAINEINRSDVNRTTTFNEYGSITEVYTDGYKVTTTFDSDTQITEKHYKDDVLYSTKVITFNADGSIKEEII